MRLGKALATGIAEEAPQEAEVAADREVTVDTQQLTGEAGAPEPVEVPAVR